MEEIALNMLDNWASLVMCSITWLIVSLDKNGEMVGLIADTSNKISDTITTKIGDVAGIDLVEVIASVNIANQRSIRTNKNYNEGFVRRRKLYNYTVANNNDYREIELFILLNRIFFVMKLIDYSSIFF